MKISILVSLLTVAFCASTPFVHCQHEDKLRDCYKKSNSNLDICLKQYFTDVKPQLAIEVRREKGNSTLSAVHVQDVRLNEKKFILKGKLLFDEVTIRGFETYEVEKVSTDYLNNEIALDLTVQRLESAGHYKADGILLLLDFHGNSTFTAEADDVKATLVFTLEEDAERFRLDHTVMYLHFGNLSGHFDDLLGGDEVGRAINSIMKTRALFLHNELKAPMEVALAAQFQEIFRNVIEEMPTELFHEEK